MEEIAIIDVLRRRAWMILLLVLGATVAGYGASFLYPAKYTATALVLVRPQQEIKMDSRNSNKEFLDFQMGVAGVETPSKTYIEIIKSSALIGQLVKKLNLDKVEQPPGFLTRHMPEFLKPAFEGFKQSLKNAMSYITHGKVIAKDSFAEAVKAVQDGLALEARPETYIFTIKYTASEAQLAADIANSVAKSFISFMEGLRLSEFQYSRDRLRAEREKGLRELERTRQDVEYFKKAHIMFRYGAEYESKLKGVSELQSSLAKLDEQAAGLAAVSSPNLSTSSATLSAKRENLLAQIRDRQAELAPMPQLERELKQLELAEKVALSAYEAVERQFQEAEIKNSAATREVQLAAEAVTPQLPSGPSRIIFALVALFSALVIGIALAFLVEYLNRSVRSVRDVEDLVGIKVLATIPRVSLSGWSGVNP